MSARKNKKRLRFVCTSDGMEKMLNAISQGWSFGCVTTVVNGEDSEKDRSHSWTVGCVTTVQKMIRLKMV